MTYRSLMLILAGCTSQPMATVETTPTTAPDDNVIDAVVSQLADKSALGLAPEDTAVLCRRLSIDLNGIVPSSEELHAICGAGHSAAEMADYFMAKTSSP